MIKRGTGYDEMMDATNGLAVKPGKVGNKQRDKFMLGDKVGGRGN